MQEATEVTYTLWVETVTYHTNHKRSSDGGADKRAARKGATKMTSCVDGDRLIVALEGSIIASNTDGYEREIDALMQERGMRKLELDLAKVDYISSAGLRMVLRLAKKTDDLVVTNASDMVYSVFEISGLSGYVEVRRALREVSVDNLKMIGAGANGRVFRLDDERIIKVYNPVSNTSEHIRRERDASRKAFVKGIPSAISFELVRVGDSYGIIYEMIDAHTLGETIARHPERLEEYARRMAQMLKQLHATEFKEGELPDARLSLHAWADVAQKSGLYSEEVASAMRAAIDSIPPRNTFVHGDFHPGNIMVTDDDEFLLIDMGDASMGDPVIDLAGACQIMVLMRTRPGATRLYTGLDEEMTGRVWDAFIREYLGCDDDATVAATVERLKFYGVIRTLGGLTFSKALPDSERAALAAKVSGIFLAGCRQLGIV